MSDNWIKGTGGYGIECYGVETRDSVMIANNTFTNTPATYGSGDAIWLYDCSPTIANNIICGMERCTRCGPGQRGAPAQQLCVSNHGGLPVGLVLCQ